MKKIEEMSPSQIKYETKRAMKKGFSSLEKYIESKLKKSLTVPKQTEEDKFFELISHPKPEKNNYGCEVATNFKGINTVKRYISLFNSTDVIRVPRRQNGMTSSGEFNECHDNVKLLVELYGGTRVTGYLIDTLPKIPRYISFLCHSVWKTPEGKLVDVTKFKNENPSHNLFIPIREVKDKSECIEYRSFVTNPDNPLDISMMDIEDGDHIIKKLIPLKFQIFKVLLRKGLIFERQIGEEYTFIKCPITGEIKFQNSYSINQGGFTKPSLFSKKTYYETVDSHGMVSSSTQEKLVA